jgi:hypothetical protein
MSRHSDQWVTSATLDPPDPEADPWPRVPPIKPSERRTCDTCNGTRLVTVEVAAYSLTWGCHCDDGARESRPPIAAE